MDTTLAAYKYAQEKWDPAWFNSVVIFTDGAADDTSSLSLDSLVNQLKTLRDPAKPVKVIIIGSRRTSDTGELDEIATATGGQKYVVNNPNEILGDPGAGAAQPLIHPHDEGPRRILRGPSCVLRVPERSDADRVPDRLGLEEPGHPVEAGLGEPVGVGGGTAYALEVVGRGHLERRSRAPRPRCR